jgi:hypothetical protein
MDNTELKRISEAAFEAHYHDQTHAAHPQAALLKTRFMQLFTANVQHLTGQLTDVRFIDLDNEQGTGELRVMHIPLQVAGVYMETAQPYYDPAAQALIELGKDALGERMRMQMIAAACANVFVANDSSEDALLDIQFAALTVPSMDKEGLITSATAEDPQTAHDILKRYVELTTFDGSYL